MTNHRSAGESSIAFAPSQPVPVIDLATDLPVGYFTGEYLHTRARSGLVFFHANRAWKILYIAVDETVSVLRLKDSSIILSNSTPQVAQSLRKQPTTQFIIESFQNYLIIHTHLSGSVNSTLRLAFDAMLTEQDLTRDSYNDGTGILVETEVKVTREELESIKEDFSHVGPEELEIFLQKAIDSIFPLIISEDPHSLKESQARNPLERELRSGLDIHRAKTVIKKIADGKIKILTHFSTVMATPLAKELIRKRAKMNSSNLEAIINENVPRFKKTTRRKTAELLCFDCLLTRAPVEIAEIEDKPVCNRCGSGLLALVGAPEKNIHNLIREKKSGKHLNTLETKRVANARRTADLILSYGKSAIIALTVTGIGPQTASTILASMHTNISEFYHDLLKAKIQYITTRELWGKPRTPSSLANHGKFNS